MQNFIMVNTVFKIKNLNRLATILIKKTYPVTLDNERETMPSHLIKPSEIIQ